MLWRIDNTECYLCGSMHLLRPEHSNLPAELWRVRERSTRLVFESDLDVTKAPAFAIMGGGRASKDVVPGSLYSKALARWQLLDVKLDLCRQKPWWAGVVISVLTGIQEGYSLKKGVDRQLWDSCDGRDREVLEDANALRALDDAPISEQIVMLEKAVDKEGTLAEFSKLAAAWRAADMSALEVILAEKLASLPYAFGELICGRNRKWMREIKRWIYADEPTLFVLGALHYVGDCSLLKLLKDEGWHTARLAWETDPWAREL